MMGKHHKLRLSDAREVEIAEAAVDPLLANQLRSRTPARAQ